MDRTPRKEQTGFREGRGCADQIFALHNIIEQCKEWQRQLYVNFVDFEKAFDSIHRDSFWNILRHYDIPSKLVQLIKSVLTTSSPTLGLASVLMLRPISPELVLYPDFWVSNIPRYFCFCFKCSVGNGDNFFDIKASVRQGSVMSAVLFNLTIDWVMRRKTEDAPRGIRWTLFSSLEDLDFADDLALLSHTQQQIQDKTDRLNTFGRQVGLRINIKKTETMALIMDAPTPVKVNGR